MMLELLETKTSLVCTLHFGVTLKSWDPKGLASGGRLANTNVLLQIHMLPGHVEAGRISEEAHDFGTVFKAKLNPFPSPGLHPACLFNSQLTSHPRSARRGLMRNLIWC